jgi:RNA polymerase sigma factor (sigma-70 family)
MRRWLRTRREAAAPEDAQVDAHGDPALRARLARAVLTLGHRQRTAFVLRYTQGLSIAEIAEVMGCAQGTVKATIHKSVMKLRRELGDLTRGET